MFEPVWGGVFTNDWVNWVLSTYSGFIALIPVILTALVKLAAIFNPNVPGDKMVDWIQQTFYKKELNGRKSKQPVVDVSEKPAVIDSSEKPT